MFYTDRCIKMGDSDSCADINGTGNERTTPLGGNIRITPLCQFIAIGDSISIGISIVQVSLMEVFCYIKQAVTICVGIRFKPGDLKVVGAD